MKTLLENGVQLELTKHEIKILEIRDLVYLCDECNFYHFC